LDLALDELRSLVERHAQPPQRTAFDLRERAVRMNDRARVDDDRELLHRDGTAAAVDADGGDASTPCGHGTFLAERGGDAEPCVLGHGSAPSRLFCRSLEYCCLPLRSADRIGRGAGIAPGAVQ